MKILLAQPRGFCAGVDRAIAIVERALAVHGAPIYVRHEIVHNKHVVNSLREKGSIFVNEIDEVPDGSVLVFSAHGVPKAVEEKARARDLTIYDATDQSPYGSHQDAQAGLPHHHDRTCRSPGSGRDGRTS